MGMIPLNPERQAQLEEYAERRRQDPAVALDEALATYLEWNARISTKPLKASGEDMKT